jgi:anti-sigma regulatory factor (Ser/Thr protein kinase)
LLIEDLTPEVDGVTATLEWLVNALQHTRSRRQTRVVGYLEEVADDVEFEVEMAARRTSLTG